MDDTTRVAALVPPRSLEIGQNSFIRCPSVRCNKCADGFDHVAQCLRRGDVQNVPLDIAQCRATGLAFEDSRILLILRE